MNPPWKKSRRAQPSLDSRTFPTLKRRASGLAPDTAARSRRGKNVPDPRSDVGSDRAKPPCGRIGARSRLAPFFP